MLQAIWHAGSLRSWVLLALALAVLPLLVSAVLGFVLLSHGVLAAFDDVARRQRYQLEPTQSLRLLLLETGEPLDVFVDDADPTQPPTYRELRQQIEARFASLHENLRTEAELQALVERARDDWSTADGEATEVISIRRPPGDPHGAELMQAFHGKIAAAVDKLGAASNRIEAQLRPDHDQALLDFERSEWVAGIAAAISLLGIAAGAFAIGRMLSVSVDRLVDGAARFAAGDRTHRIQVQVPPELHRVAEEFNRMIGRIHESEAALADLARRDGLTKLLNRRAFDDALAEAIARVQRLAEPIALLILDLDHFKRINDAHGHAAGDEMLRAAARAMVSEVRIIDRVFRIGGEEFAILLTGADATAAEATAERLRQSIAALSIPVHGAEIGATVSIGIALGSQSSEPGNLVETADKALYRAKSQGRNRVVIGDEGAAPDPAPA